MDKIQTKPELNGWQIWNMCFGFLGIQFGFALQNASTSRIFQTLGADMGDLAILWVAAPVSGLIVQPIIGYMSDRTWSKLPFGLGLGRRRPYFFWGAVLTSLSLIIMPNSTYLWMAAGMLWIMDASINITMEPFRAFVGDNLPVKQRPTGFAMQSFFIGIGSVAASLMPWVLTNVFGVTNTAPEGVLPDSVIWSFYAGALVLFVTVFWTVLRSKEYDPETLQSFEALEPEEEATPEADKQLPISTRLAQLLVAIGAFFTFVIVAGGFDKELLVITICIGSLGLLCLFVLSREKSGIKSGGLYEIMYDLFTMPSTMRQLAALQLFSWMALFAMWIYMTPAVTAYHFGAVDPTSQAYNDGADWVGVLFAAYNAFAALAAFLLPVLARKFGRQKAHMIALFLGAAGYFSMYLFKNPDMLILSMAGVGIAWASILSMPYAMLANSVPAKKMGIYMGIFNFFIVLPQMLAASVLGVLVRNVFDDQAIYALVVGAISWIIAGLLSLRVKDGEEQPA